MSVYTPYALIFASSQIFQEAAPILYANTTFSVTLAQTLSVWVGDMSPFQRHHIKILHLDITLEPKESYWTRGIRDFTKSISSLTNLQVLHFSICFKRLDITRLHNANERNYIHTYSFPNFLKTLHEGVMPWGLRHLVVFRKSRRLRIVTAIIKDDLKISLYGQQWTMGHQEAKMHAQGRWTMAQKAELARIMVAKLLS